MPLILQEVVILACLTTCSCSTSSTYEWYVLYEEEGNKMYVLRDSLFLQDVLYQVDLIVAMGVLPIIDGMIQSGGQRA